MSILLIPASFSLVVKLLILAVLIAQKSHSRIFNSMLFVFACHNICEILVYLEMFNHINTDWLVRVYYSLSVLGMMHILLYALEVSKVANLPAKINYATAFSIVAVLAILFSDTIVTGSAPLGYTVTALHGSGYLLFQALVVFSMFATIGVLAQGYRKNHDHLSQTQCLYTLLAIVPLTLVGPTVVALQALGVTINASLLLPVFSTLYLLVIILGESTHRLTDIRMYLPRSLEHQTSKKLFDACALYSSNTFSIKQAQEDIERTLILHALKKNKYNFSETARQIQMKRSTLYSACNRLGIEPSTE